MKAGRVFAYFAAFQKRHTAYQARSAMNLLVFQFVFVGLMTATGVLVCVVNRGTRLAFYITMLSALIALVAASIYFNMKGRFLVSAWITTICMVLGPWASILLDPSVLAGDFMPLIYVGISIQLCSILLTERATLTIAALQLCAVVGVILCSPALRALNWPSLIAFIVFTATIGIMAGFSNRKQLEQIEKQRNELLEDEAKLRELSVRDPLTGLFNRRYMEETLDREISRALRKNLPLAVVMVDIDGFKTINDTFGHVPGDDILLKVATFLGGSVRQSDVACRFGGDEFLLILPECALEEAFHRADDMRRAVEAMAFSPDKVKKSERVTLSFGVAALPDDGDTREELLSAADKALYASKRAGRNRVNGRVGGA